MRMGDYNPTLIENENYIDLNCAMIRKEALDRCGGFDISCRGSKIGNCSCGWSRKRRRYSYLSYLVITRVGGPRR